MPRVFIGNISAPKYYIRVISNRMCVYLFGTNFPFLSSSSVESNIYAAKSCQLANNTSVLSHSLSQPSWPKCSTIRLCENYSCGCFLIEDCEFLGHREHFPKEDLPAPSLCSCRRQPGLIPWTKEIRHLPVCPLHLLLTSPSHSVLATMGSWLFFKMPSTLASQTWTLLFLLSGM